MTLEDNMGAEGDAIYAALMQAHEGLNEAESHSLNARLILMMMNEIGDAERLASLFEAARSFEGSEGPKS
ncbi:MAG: DUF2783 domain-containing protein [Pseudomonadota bacterium]